ASASAPNRRLSARTPLMCPPSATRRWATTSSSPTHRISPWRCCRRIIPGRKCDGKRGLTWRAAPALCGRTIRGGGQSPSTGPGRNRSFSAERTCSPGGRCFPASRSGSLTCSEPEGEEVGYARDDHVRYGRRERDRGVGAGERRRGDVRGGAAALHRGG